jgi:hypothetical protein
MRGDLLKGVVLGSIVSTVVLLAASAMAGTGVGAVFNLGKANTVNAQSTLKGATSGSNLQITNTGSGGALGINVGAGKPPIVVNSNAGVAKNLNAAKVDGRSVLTFSKLVATNTTTPQKAMTLGGFTLKLACDPSGGPTLTGIGSVGGSLINGLTVSAGQGDYFTGQHSNVIANAPITMFYPADGYGEVVWQYATPAHHVVSINAFVDQSHTINGFDGCSVSGSAIAH